MGGQARDYRRSWRNLLLDRRYQLRFTLFMVGLAGLLMAGLGVWVMRVAARSSTVTAIGLDGAMKVECKDPARAAVPAAAAPAAAATAPPAAAERPRGRAVVTIDESMMPAAAPRPIPATPVAAVAAFEACKQKYLTSIAELATRTDRIVYALIGSALVLMLGLTGYGIKMTHRVAGPLHKISLYLDKLRAGRYQPLHNLRKGDQLIEFYEHFRLAYAGVRKLDEDDAVRLRATLAAADQAGLAAKSPELAAAIVELRAILADKEASLA